MEEKQAQKKPVTAKIAEGARASEHLANERTFLAWIRTSIAVIGLGFVVAKFSIWLNQLATTAGLRIPHLGVSMPVGVAMLAFGGLLAILAYYRYNVIHRQIEQGEVKADRGLIGLVTLFVVVLSIAVVIYMFITNGLP